MGIELIHVEPSRVVPPHRPGPQPRRQSTIALDKPAPLDTPTGYPWDLSVPDITVYANAPDFAYHGGAGIVIDTYA